jgi:hypothetical protein
MSGRSDTVAAGAPRQAGHLLDRLFGIPHLSPIAAGLFRIALGLTLVVLLWIDTAIGYPRGAIALNPGSGYGAGTWTLSHWIRLNHGPHLAIYWTAFGAAVSLTLGWWTRVSAAVLWVMLFLLVAATLTNSGNHTWGAPLIALFGLWLTPLGDALSLDAVRRRSTGSPSPAAVPSAAYGFACWWIGLVLSLAFLAAALTKLRFSGLDWALGGAVRYHFVEDASHAPVAWGLWVAGQPALTVALSTFGLLAEATFIVVIFIRRAWLRAAFGLVFLAMHGGFYLFQGVLWLPWHAMALAFVPWQSIVNWRAAAPPAVASATGPRLRPLHALAVVTLCVMQAYASIRAKEYEPLLSHFPMYSGTFASWSEFFATRRWHKYQSYRFFARDENAQRVELTAPTDVLSSLDVDRLIDTLQALYRNEEVPERSVPALAALGERLRARYGPGGDRLEVVVEVRTVNFEQMRVEAVATDLHAFTLQLSPPALSFVAPEFTTALASP